MTREETASLLRYMLTMYPSVKMTEQQFNNSVNIWSVEFANDTCDAVGAAFRLARAESPDWIPSIPRIQQAMRLIASSIHVKSKEQEFMDAHCGKSESEWQALMKWESSVEGSAKIREYKQRLAELIGG